MQGSESEKEVERFLKVLLPGSPYANKVHAVGGYVRDQYLSLIKKDPSIEAKDLDIVVDMKGGAEKVTGYIYDIFQKTDKSPVSKPRQLGAGYPIWQVTFKEDVTYKGEKYKTKGAVIEFADAMKESFPDPQSRQRKTEPGTIKEDIARRDFTVNMLLKDMTSGEIEDLTGTSKADIAQGILKGHPQVSLDQTFENDPLRMIRLIRFQCKYGWDIPRSVLKVVKRNADRIDIVSSERIMEELKKVMKLGKLRQAIKLMSATGLLKYVLPEVEALKGVKQPEEHHGEGDVYRHTLKVLENAPSGVDAQMAALLHDIGKPQTTEIIQEKIRSHGHEKVGEEIAEAILRRLKFDNKAIDRIKRMVRYHMRPHRLSEKPTTKAIRRFVREVGEELTDAILDLASADELGRIPSSKNIPELRKKIKEVQEQTPSAKKEPVLKGQEIMDLLGIKQGPQVGEAKKFLTDLEDDYIEKGKALTEEKAKEELKKKFKKASLSDVLRVSALSLA